MLACFHFALSSHRHQSYFHGSGIHSSVDQQVWVSQRPLHPSNHSSIQSKQALSSTSDPWRSSASSTSCPPPRMRTSSNLAIPSTAVSSRPFFFHLPMYTFVAEKDNICKCTVQEWYSEERSHACPALIPSSRVVEGVIEKRFQRKKRPLTNKDDEGEPSR